MKRAAISVPSNIAEGFARYSRKDFHRFLKISLGSLYELNTQLQVAKRRSFIDQEQFALCNSKIILLGKMINTILRNYTE
jgi:four helix bundle protein